jgi:pyridoxamine 5'-phosphate oxidase
VIANREALEASLAHLTEQYSGGVVPLPPHWGGYRVKPEMFEFWQGRTNRLHDRFRYRRYGSVAWIIERLAP